MARYHFADIWPYLPIADFIDYKKVGVCFRDAQMNIEERIILNEIAKRNEAVFKALFLEYYEKLLRYAEGFVFDLQVAEDIVQLVFITLWEKGGSLAISSTLNGYLFQAVRNRSLSHLRDLKVYDKHRLLYLESMVNDNFETEMSSGSELSQKIDREISKLPPEMAKIFRAKYLEGKKTDEIATLFDISENTVKTQLQRARKKLREKLLDSTCLFFYF